MPGVGGGGEGTGPVPSPADSVENPSGNVAPSCSFFSSTLERRTPHGGPVRQLWCIREEQVMRSLLVALVVQFS